MLALVLILAACADPAPLVTDLVALSEAQKDFDGREVVVRGTLRTFDQPRHYWIENASLDRVAVRGAGEIGQWVGQTIEVRGTFSYDPGAGRRIEVKEIVVLP